MEMDLGELKSHIESFPKGTKFSYSLSEPFSWRGIYAEVAFAIEDKLSDREELLAKIDRALNEVFEGWKGGEFRYKEYTPVHFEQAHGDYTDGGYAAKKIAEIEGFEVPPTLEHRLVYSAFNPSKTHLAAPSPPDGCG